MEYMSDRGEFFIKDSGDIELIQFDNFDVRKYTHLATEDGGVDTDKMLKTVRKFGLDSGDVKSGDIMQKLSGICKDRDSKATLRETLWKKNEVTRGEIIDIAFLVEYCALKMREEIQDFLSDQKVGSVVSNYNNYDFWIGSWERVATFLSKYSSASGEMPLTVMLPVLELYWEDELRPEGDRILTNTESTGGELKRNIDGVMENVTPVGFMDKMNEEKEKFLSLKNKKPAQ